jgi:gamma-glutamyl hercynylcysteine S-oxide hydrolase
MCRHVAYLGAPLTLSALLHDQPHSLQHQSYAPRLQRHGVVNADGFGAGWYLPGRDVPVRYRRDVPIWTDASWHSLAPTVRSGCVLAAVRSTATGSPVEESCAAPFLYDRWLFSHNGAVQDLTSLRAAQLPALSDIADVSEAFAPSDSALLFGMAVRQWRRGASLADGLANVVAATEAVGPARLNLLATDGVSLAGTVAGDTLFIRQRGASVILASEPFDDGSDWRQLPERSLVVATADGVQIKPLADNRRPTRQQSLAPADHPMS